jgi:hypothetical protein
LKSLSVYKENKQVFLGAFFSSLWLLLSAVLTLSAQKNQFFLSLQTQEKKVCDSKNLMINCRNIKVQLIVQTKTIGCTIYWFLWISRG